MAAAAAPRRFLDRVGKRGRVGRSSKQKTYDGTAQFKPLEKEQFLTEQELQFETYVQEITDTGLAAFS